MRPETRPGRRQNGAGAEPVEQLERLGITRNEAKVYLTLLRLQSATAAELSDIANVPRAKVYAVLRSLEDKGFTAPVDGPVTRFHPIDSGLALANWIKQRQYEREVEADADIQQVADLRASLPPILARAPDGSEGYIEGVFGRARITEASEDLIKSAQDRLLMIQRPPYFQKPSRWNVLEVEALKRGVAVKVIYSQDALNDETRYAALKSSGAELRVYAAAPMKLIVADGWKALVALRDPLTGEHGVRSASIQHPDLVAALELLFQKEWDRAKPLASASSPG